MFRYGAKWPIAAFTAKETLIPTFLIDVYVMAILISAGTSVHLATDKLINCCPQSGSKQNSIISSFVCLSTSKLSNNNTAKMIICLNKRRLVSGWFLIYSVEWLWWKCLSLSRPQVSWFEAISWWNAELLIKLLRATTIPDHNDY